MLVAKDVWGEIEGSYGGRHVPGSPSALPYSINFYFLLKQHKRLSSSNPIGEFTAGGGQKGLRSNPNAVQRETSMHANPMIKDANGSANDLIAIFNFIMRPYGVLLQGMSILVNLKSYWYSVLPVVLGADDVRGDMLTTRRPTGYIIQQLHSEIVVLQTTFNHSHEYPNKFSKPNLLTYLNTYKP
jgi:hypothetical protein